MSLLLEYDYVRQKDFLNQCNVYSSLNIVMTIYLYDKSEYFHKLIEI